MLNYSHNVLLTSDIAQFAAQKSQLADELKSGKLDLPYAMYNLAKSAGLSVINMRWRSWLNHVFQRR